MTEAAIELRGVSRRFAGTTVLSGLDLEVAPGVVGLLGPNGAGKTTLLRILATVLGAHGGSVRILGRDPAERAGRVEIRRRLGYLPQELGYPRGFTAYRFVDYMAVLKEIEDPATRRAEVRRVLEDVGLADRAAKRIRALSGGQRRRVGLAQALLGAPELLVLDEPTSGLDPEQRVSLRHVLAERGRAATVLIATHQTEDVAALCEHVIVLDEGSVSFQGTVSALVTEAQGRVWLADVADPRAQVSWRTATGRYRNVGVAPPDAELVEPTLEDAYLLLRGATEAETEQEVAA
jgi:ABC-2 type transport system ATP-binding protein